MKFNQFVESKESEHKEKSKLYESLKDNKLDEQVALSLSDGQSSMGISKAKGGLVVIAVGSETYILDKKDVRKVKEFFTKEV